MSFDIRSPVPNQKVIQESQLSVQASDKLASSANGKYPINLLSS